MKPRSVTIARQSLVWALLLVALAVVFTKLILEGKPTTTAWIAFAGFLGLGLSILDAWHRRARRGLAP